VGGSGIVACSTICSRGSSPSGSPSSCPTLNRRAADWFEANGDPESALEHAAALGDTASVARIVSAIGMPFYTGGAAVVERWLPRFDDQAGLDR
jgi:ATP/maltotriose-dependent transcriptional regulator MalT